MRGSIAEKAKSTVLENRILLTISASNVSRQLLLPNIPWEISTTARAFLLPTACRSPVGYPNSPSWVTFPLSRHYHYLRLSILRGVMAVLEGFASTLDNPRLPSFLDSWFHNQLSTSNILIITTYIKYKINYYSYPPTAAVFKLFKKFQDVAGKNKQSKIKNPPINFLLINCI